MTEPTLMVPSSSGISHSQPCGMDDTPIAPSGPYGSRSGVFQ